jgi:hypothetical protein
MIIHVVTKKNWFYLVLVALFKRILLEKLNDKNDQIKILLKKYKVNQIEYIGKILFIS